MTDKNRETAFRSITYIDPETGEKVVLDDVYVEPEDYFPPEALKIAEEWDRTHSEPEPDCAGIQPENKLTKEQYDAARAEEKRKMAKGFTFTKEEIEKFKAKESKMTPEERRAASKSLVEANTAANAALLNENITDSSTGEHC